MFFNQDMVWTGAPPHWNDFVSPQGNVILSHVDTLEEIIVLFKHGPGDNELVVLLIHSVFGDPWRSIATSKDVLQSAKDFMTNTINERLYEITGLKPEVKRPLFQVKRTGKVTHVTTARPTFAPRPTFNRRV